MIPSIKRCIVCEPPSVPDKITEIDLSEIDLSMESEGTLRQKVEDEKKLAAVWAAAIKTNNIAVVDNLISLKASPNIDLGASYSPLILAYKLGKRDILNKLLNYRETILHYSPSETHSLPIRVLYSNDKVLKNKVIKKVASVSGVTRTGDPLLHVLEGSGLKNIKELRKIIREEMSEDAIERAELWMRNKLLAHVWQIGGTSICQPTNPNDNNLVIKREGDYVLRLQKELTRALKLFVSSKEEAVAKPFQLIIKAIKAANPNRNTCQRMLDFYKENKFLIVNSGLSSHHVELLFYGSFFLILNRGDCSRSSVEVFSFDPEKLSAKIIDSLIEINSYPQEVYMMHMFQDLREDLGLTQTAFTRAIEKLLQIENQITGNCAWENSEAAVFVFSALNKLEQKGLLSCEPSEATEELKKTVEEQKQQSSEWLAFAKELFLDEFIDFSSREERNYLPDLLFLEEVRKKADPARQTTQKLQNYINQHKLGKRRRSDNSPKDNEQPLKVRITPASDRNEQKGLAPILSLEEDFSLSPRRQSLSRN